MNKKRSEFASPERYAEAKGYDLNKPITAEELLDIFDFRPINAECIVVDLDKTPERVAGLIVSRRIQSDHQTGSPKGQIVWLGLKAKEALEERLKACGYKAHIKPGDIVGFGALHPQPAGLSFNGQAIIPGVDESRWAGISFIHWDDVRYHRPAEDLQS
jgi:hypothetical protein